jgi:hypothetical protein
MRHEPASTVRGRREAMRRLSIVQTICRRVRAGERQPDVLRDCLMPQRTQLMAWVEKEPTLGELLAEAHAAAKANGLARRKAALGYCEALIDELLARIADGRGLAEVCEEPDMPDASTVTRWIAERPELLTRYLLAREMQADRLFDVAWRIARDAEEETVRSSRLKIETLKWRVGKLAPRRYGGLKAQAPAGAAGAAEEAGPDRLIFELRHFAVTPDRKVVETTKAVRGMGADDRAELWAQIADGRVSEAELAARNAAAEP